VASLDDEHVVAADLGWLRKGHSVDEYIYYIAESKTGDSQLTSHSYIRNSGRGWDACLIRVIVLVPSTLFCGSAAVPQRGDDIECSAGATGASVLLVRGKPSHRVDGPIWSGEVDK